MTAAPAPIAIESVGKRYVTPSEPIPVVEGVSLTVRPREFVSLLGRSGCNDGSGSGLAFIHSPLGSTAASDHLPRPDAGLQDLTPAPLKITGNPDVAHIPTSYAERANLTMRMGMRRLTRLTNGFSKKVDNHKAAIALHLHALQFRPRP